MGKIFGAISGFGIVLAGFAIFGYQTYLLLRTGGMPPFSIVDIGRYILAPEEAPWLYFPQDWIGLYEALQWFPASLAFMLVGVFVVKASE